MPPHLAPLLDPAEMARLYELDQVVPGGLTDPDARWLREMLRRAVVREPELVVDAYGAGRADERAAWEAAERRLPPVEPPAGIDNRDLAVAAMVLFVLVVIVLAALAI